jgi:hypothetical protein
MRRARPRHQTVRAAAAWATGPGGDRQIAIALAGATDMLWDAQNCNDEGARLYAVVEPWVDETIPRWLAARYWYTVSNSRLLVRLKQQAQAGLRAVELFRSLGDRSWLFRAQQSAALKFSFLADQPAARTALNEMQELFDPSWPAWCRTAVEHGLGFFEYFAAHRPEAARKHLDAAVEIHRRAGGDGYFAEHSALMLLSVDLSRGDFEAVVQRGGDLLSGFQIGKRRAQALVARAGALTALGRLEEAEESLRAAVPLVRHGLGSASWALCYAPYLLARQQRMGDAARIIGYIEEVVDAVALTASPATGGLLNAAKAIISATLDAKGLHRLIAEGQRLTEDEAIALAFPPRP